MGVSAIQLNRPLSKYEKACQINYAELVAKQDQQTAASQERLVADVNAIEANIVNQVKRYKVLKDGNYSRISKVTVNTTPFRQHLLNSFVYFYFDGRQDARKEIENSLGKRLRLKYANAPDLLPVEAMERFQKRAAVTKAEFTRMAAKERARAFTVAGVLEQDMLATTRQGLIKAIDEGWSLNEFSRYLKDANVKYTGTVYGTDKKKGEPLTPYHLETVLRTNYATVYNEGRLDMMNHPDVVEFVPAFEYSAILDTRTRKTHRDMDGRIYPRDDPIWRVWYPPNGFSCRCIAIPVTSNMDFSVSQPAPAGLRPDTGFGDSRITIPPAPTRGEVTGKEVLAQSARKAARLVEVPPLDKITREDIEKIIRQKMDFIKTQGVSGETVDELRSYFIHWLGNTDSPGGTKLQYIQNIDAGRKGTFGFDKDMIETLGSWSPSDEMGKAATLWSEYDKEIALRSLGSGPVQVYRGIRGDYAQQIKDAVRESGGIADIPMRSLNAFTIDKGDAGRYSDWRQGDIILEAPADIRDEIFATYISSPISLAAHEVILSPPGRKEFAVSWGR